MATPNPTDHHVTTHTEDSLPLGSDDQNFLTIFKEGETRRKREGERKQWARYSCTYPWTMMVKFLCKVKYRSP